MFVVADSLWRGARRCNPARHTGYHAPSAVIVFEEADPPLLIAEVERVVLNALRKCDDPAVLTWLRRSRILSKHD
jgi:hypothetical protein